MNDTTIRVIATSTAAVLITLILAIAYCSLEETRIHVAAGHVEALGQSQSAHWVAPAK